MKQLGLETGQSVEMGTIHAGDFMVRLLVKKIHFEFLTLIMDNMSFVSSYVIFFLNEYRGVFVQILG